MGIALYQLDMSKFCESQVFQSDPTIGNRGI